MKRRGASWFLGVLSLGLVLAAAGALPSRTAAASVPFTAIDLGAFAGGSSFPSGMNDSGVVVGASATTPGTLTTHAFVWTQTGGMVDLGVLGDSATFPGSYATAVNNAGEVVGSSAIAGCGPDYPNAWHAFSWTRSGGMVDLGVLPGANRCAFSVASAIDARGDIVGRSMTGSGGEIHAVLWPAAGGIVDLDTSVHGYSSAEGITDTGWVYGETSASGNHLAFSWTQSDGMVDLPTLGGESSYNLEVWGNEAGQLVGSSHTVSGNQRAFLWTPGVGIVDLPTPGWLMSAARGVNDSGQVVGSECWFECHAVVWGSGSVIDLGGGIAVGSSPSASFIVHVHPISDRGQVVGTSYTDSGPHAFSWTEATGMVDLGPSLYSGAYLVNENGQVAGESAGYHAMVWLPRTDSVPPVARPTQSPGPNPAGWNNTDVTVTWNWTDNQDGSGTDPGRCTSASTSSGEGTIVLSATCTDRAGNTGSACYTVKVDKTPPVVTPQTASVAASTWAGATIGPIAAAADDRDGPVPVNCSQHLDGLFPVGDTPVTCWATDEAGNNATAAFTIHVRGAPEQIEDLKVAVSGIPTLRAILMKDLMSDLDAASRALANGHVPLACNDLWDFTDQLQTNPRPAQIGRQQRGDLIAAATRIRAVLGVT
jgi:probable HAF family extracellular repeat protein